MERELMRHCTAIQFRLCCVREGVLYCNTNGLVLNYKFWLCIKKCEGSDIYFQLPKLLYYHLTASDELSFHVWRTNRISINLKRHLLIQSCVRLTRILKMDVSQCLFITY